MLPLVVMLPCMFHLVERYACVAEVKRAAQTRVYYGATVDGDRRLGVEDGEAEYAYESPRPGDPRRKRTSSAGSHGSAHGSAGGGSADEEAPLVPLSPGRHSRRSVKERNEELGIIEAPLTIREQVWPQSYT